MKQFKVVPEAGWGGGIVYRIYKRVLWIFWEYEVSAESWEEAEKLVASLKQPDRFL